MNTLFFFLVLLFTLALTILIDSLQYHLTVAEAILKLIDSHVGTISFVVITASLGLFHAIKMDRKQRKKIQSNK